MPQRPLGRPARSSARSRWALPPVPDATAPAAGEKPVRLGSRAFDILVALVERAGELVSKAELMARVWPNTFVEEINRGPGRGAAPGFGDRRGSNRYLATISGRGYRFVAPVTIAEVLSTPAERAHNLPAQIVRMIDRTDVMAALAAQLQRRRLVTIVGPGGIGKTTVALAVGRGLLGAYEYGIGFVDLAPVVDPRLVPSPDFSQGIAGRIGPSRGRRDSSAGVCGSMRDVRRILGVRRRAAARVDDGMPARSEGGAPQVEIREVILGLVRAG